MLDFLVLSVIVLFALLGFLSGLLMQVLRLVATLASVVLAISFSEPAMRAWPDLLSAYPAVRALVFPVFVFCTSYILLLLIARLLVMLFHKTSKSASAADRLLGGMAGALKGALLSYFLVYVLLSVQSKVGKPLPYFESDKSFAAAFVQAYSFGQVGDWSGCPKLRQWLGEPKTNPGQSGSR